MPRNRKNQSAAVRMGPALRAFVACALAAGVGLGFVWQKVQVHQLAREQKQREVQLSVLQQANEDLGRTWALLQTQAAIDAQVQRMGLALAPPQPQQIVRLIELPPRIEVIPSEGLEHFTDDDRAPAPRPADEARDLVRWRLATRPSSP